LSDQTRGQSQFEYRDRRRSERCEGQQHDERYDDQRYHKVRKYREGPSRPSHVEVRENVAYDRVHRLRKRVNSKQKKCASKEEKEVEGKEEEEAENEGQTEQGGRHPPSGDRRVVPGSRKRRNARSPSPVALSRSILVLFPVACISSRS
jgi:hypothetical protein